MFVVITTMFVEIELIFDLRSQEICVLCMFSYITSFSHSLMYFQECNEKLRPLQVSYVIMLK